MSIWLRAARLKLHILGMLPVLVGSLIASHRTGNFHVPQFILAELIALFVLVTTAFANDYADAETDMINRTFNMFSGGSRVIPDGLISKPQMMNAILVTSSLSVILSLVVVVFLKGHLMVLFLTLVGLMIGIEYSLPPLRLNYRGFGEIFVMFMYSIFCIFFGYVAQVGLDFDMNVLYLSMPLAASMFLMILITEIPDTESDKVSGKKTIPALFGAKASLFIYSMSVVALCAIIFILHSTGTVNRFIFSGLSFPLPIGVYLAVYPLLKRDVKPQSLSALCGMTLILNIWVNTVLTLNYAIGS